MEEWDNLPKIKFDSSIDFSQAKLEADANEDNNDNRYTNTTLNQDDAYLNDNLDKQVKENVLEFDAEPLTNKNEKKYIIALIVIFLSIIIPICYHYVSGLISMFKDESTQTPLEVSVQRYVPQPIYNESESTGLITPNSYVDVVSRVDGYLEKTFIKEGDFVHKGQLLFKIEPIEYQIAVRAEEASVAQTEALYNNSLQELNRAKELIKENFISRSDYDGIVASARSNQASLDAVKQSLARAKLNLSYTNIYAPLTGKAGKIALSDGNYVSMGSGALVRIAQTNPVDVSFSIKSADAIKHKQANNGQLDLTNTKVELVLSDGNKYNHVGKINFTDNYISEDASTLSVKAIFDNPDNILVPGDYVKVILTSKMPIYKFLIPQSVTNGDALNGYYLWSVKDGKTRKLPINVSGSKGNSWIVESGVTETDDIIISSNNPIDMNDFVVSKIIKEDN